MIIEELYISKNFEEHVIDCSDFEIYSKKYFLKLKIHTDEDITYDTYTVMHIEKNVSNRRDFLHYNTKVQIADESFEYYDPNSDEQLIDYLEDNYGFLDTDIIICKEV